MNNFAVTEPILNSPFKEPEERWWILEGEAPKWRSRRRFSHNVCREPYSAISESAAEKWIDTLNSDGGFGVWTYAIAKKVSDVPALISSAAH